MDSEQDCVSINLSNLPATVESERFFLRELTPDDVSKHYLGWVQEDAGTEFIAHKSKTMAELTSYVKEKYESQGCWFLGIWCKDSWSHVGNIKFEPFDPVSAWCVLGILIGDQEYRGRGAGKEVMKVTIGCLFGLGIKEVALGVSSRNLRAIRLYEGMGFERRPHAGVNPSDESLAMVLRCDDWES